METTMRVGVYFRNLDEEYQLSVFRGIREEARKRKVELICIQQEEPNWKTPEKLFPSLAYLKLNGFLILTSVLSGSSEAPQINNKIYSGPGIPWVSLGVQLEGVPSVFIDSDFSQGRILEHLIEEHGYRKLLYLGGPIHHPDNIKREKYFYRKVSEYNQQYPDLSWTVKNAGFTERSGYSLTHRMIFENPSHPYDALVAANDTMAAGALKAIKSSGNRLWSQMAVTGFDDIPQARFLFPALTTVRQPLEKMGQMGLDLLLSKIKGKTNKSSISIPALPLIRQSCGCPLAENEPGSGENEIKIPAETIQHSLWLDHYLQQVSELGQRMISQHSLTEVLSSMQDFLILLGVQRYDLLLYNYPEKEKADRVFHLQHESATIHTPKKNPIFLNDFFKALGQSEKDDTDCYALQPLLSGNQILGLVLYQADDVLLPHISNSLLFLANTLQRLYLEEKEINRREILEKEVNKRTEALQQANRQLGIEAERRIDLEAQVLKISDMERLRFSLDLHDDICQRLAGISLFARSFTKHEGGTALCEMLEDTLTRTRAYAHQFFPVDLGELGLNEAIQNLCRTLENQTRAVCNYSWEGDQNRTLTEKQAINLYRIAQEAVQNIIKHAHAGVVDIRIRVSKNKLELSIQDNGKGKAPENINKPLPDQLEKRGRKPSGLGLRSMQYRAHQLEGEFHFNSSETKGTSVIVSIPL